ncbi:hypothetical protein [Miniimonas arenae]|uniref:hypothetical protein n=1 Tax=Miniimonas arenae TaxID=676201 RepID=UPI001FE2D336|nr:hypothetical protein [Miniimonas arenae]
MRSTAGTGNPRSPSTSKVSASVRAMPTSYRHSRAGSASLTLITAREPSANSSVCATANIPPVSRVTSTTAPRSAVSGATISTSWSVVGSTRGVDGDAGEDARRAYRAGPMLDPGPVMGLAVHRRSITVAAAR